jgi:cell cycle sensor histidine kinase DivJ
VPDAFELSVFVIRYAELIRAVAAGCDRLVHAFVIDEAARAEQRRLIGMLIAGPFLLSAAAWTLLPAGLGLAHTFGFISASFCASALSVLAVTARRDARLVLTVALVLAAVQIAVLIAAAGGLRSPASLIACALPVEAWLTFRTRRALGRGAAAMAAALVLPAVMTGPFAGAQAAAWHWLIPLAYAATLLPRLGAFLAVRPAPSVLPQAEPGRLPLSFSTNGDLRELGAAARDMLGIDPDLLAGTGFFERIHVADRVGFLCALADLRDAAGHRKVELRLHLPAGEGKAAYRPFAAELSSAGAGGGDIAATLRDNSEVAELRAALASAKEESANLDVAKSRFLAVVSHELRTPLNSIIGFSDMLLCEIHGRFSDPRQREQVQIVRDAGTHLLELVNSILDVSRIESGAYPINPEPFRFGEASALSVSLIRPQAEAKQIVLGSDVQPSLGEIRADRRAVQQMLINLLSNAVKFTPKGGRVSLGAKRIGSRLHFWVSDTGIGIAENDLNRLGEPFTQVKSDYTRQSEGTGLGLALVKGLVALHQGTMSIDSALGQGTTVTISLPVDGPTMAVDADRGIALLRGKASGENANGSLRKAS